MMAMLRLAVTVALSSMALAQNVSDAEIVRAAKSPYDLARYIDSHARIDDWKPLWSAMGKSGDPPELLPRCEPFPEDTSCSTELITVPKPSQVIVLLQTDPPSRECVPALSGASRRLEIRRVLLGERLYPPPRDLSVWR